MVVCVAGTLILTFQNGISLCPHAKRHHHRRGTPLWLPRGRVGYAKRTHASRLTRWISPPRMFPASWLMSGGMMRSAYPAPHRGSHKGVPLRGQRPPLPFGHFPRQRGQPVRLLRFSVRGNLPLVRHLPGHPPLASHRAPLR